MNGSASSQDAAVAFLSDPRTHGLRDGEVRRIETHGAIVFLAGERVYKIKRAVKYPYLDYSTLERREAACRAELEANRPFAPEIYLGVSAVVRRPGGELVLDGEDGGEPVEWAVVMRRFDERLTLDHVATDEGISDALARALGEAVAAAHRTAPRFDAEAWIDALGRFVADESRVMRTAGLFDRRAADGLAQALAGSLDRIRPQLGARGEGGFVRRGHGDLHLRNVALIDGRPVLFDALEFDPVVAAGDVLYDLAFLLMDLLARDLGRAANIVFNRYLAAAGDDAHLDALEALPFFLALRAAIRMRVALDKRAISKDAERRAAEAEASGYFALARRLIAPPAPQLVAIGGLSGTGKSTVAAALAAALLPAPGAVHLRADVERKRLAGVGELDRLPADAYTPESSQAVYARLNALAGRVLSARHAAIVDAVHARPDERAAVEKAARAGGFAFRGVWLDLPLDARTHRVGARRGDASDADAAVARAQEQYDLGAIGWLRVDASGDADAVVRRVREALGV